MTGRLEGGASRAFAVTYLLIEGGAIACYWLALWLFPESRHAFTPEGAPSASLWALLPAEVGLVVSSCVAAFAVHRRLP